MPTAPRFLAPLLALALSASLLQGCYGQFNLTRKLYNWNGTVGDKWINSLLMFIISPAYSIASGVDYIILNPIEFWTGSNPVTFAPKEREIRTVEWEGRKFILTATRNRIDMAQAEGDPRVTSLIYDPDTRAWYAESSGKRTLLAQSVGSESGTYDLFLPDGTHERVSVK